MNAIPALPGRPAFPEGGMAVRRCARHTTREAAARCPVCGNFFCRECVVEHEGRLLCSTCLAKQVAARVGVRPRWEKTRRVLNFAAAALVAWLAFFLLGTLLLKIPPAFHEGTIWKAPAGDSP